MDCIEPEFGQIFLGKFQPDNYCPPSIQFFFKAQILFFGPVEILGAKFRRALTRDWLGEFGPNFQDTVGSTTAAKYPNKIMDMFVE